MAPTAPLLELMDEVMYWVSRYLERDSYGLRSPTLSECSSAPVPTDARLRWNRLARTSEHSHTPAWYGRWRVARAQTPFLIERTVRGQLQGDEDVHRIGPPRLPHPPLRALQMPHQTLHLRHGAADLSFQERLDAPWRERGGRAYLELDGEVQLA
jgi:hypothetical protein